METHVAKRSDTLLEEGRSHRLGCTANHTCCVWLLTEVCLSSFAVGERSTLLLDVTVLLTNSGASQITETFPSSKNAYV
jgi:hypothetical protein